MEAPKATAKTSPSKNNNKAPPPPPPPTTTRENVHTNVLGIDAGDSELHYSSSKTSDSATSNSNSASATSTLDTGNSPSRSNRRFVRSPGKETKSNSNKTNTVGPPSPMMTAYQPIVSPPTRRPAISDAEADVEVADTTTTNTNDDTNNKWWGTRLFGGNNNDDSNNDSSSNNNSNNNSRSERRRRRVVKNKVAADANYECPDTTVASSSTTLDSSFAGGTATAATASAADIPATTKEDRIRQSASFFYRGMEDGDPLSPMNINNSRRMSVGGGGSGSGRRRNMRNIIPSSNSLLRNMSSRHSRILSGRDGVVFMSKYERLNQDIRRPRRKNRQQQQHENDHSSSNNNDDNNNNDSNNDLFLDEETSSCDYREHIPNPTNNVVMDATSLTNPHGVRSSLFYEQDGRMLMKLPRDQVRLVMDYDLEPGILSVEQWRNREDAERTAIEAMTAMTTRTTERELRRQQYRQQQQHQQRRRRRRRQQLQEQEQERKEIFDDDDNNEENKTDDDENAIDEDSDPLKSEGGGQQPTEVIQQKQQQQKRSKNDYLYDDEYYSDSDNYDYDNDNDYYDMEEDRNPVLLPELSYVITVPPDLYQRLVGEMSAKAFPPYWGFCKCVTQEGERADIKLALFILLIVMLLLGAGSLEWPTD